MTQKFSKEEYDVITVNDYFKGYTGHGGIKPIHHDRATILLDRVNTLLRRALETGKVDLETNPYTGTLIGGQRNGGWRPQECSIGAPNSAHKTGEAVDVYDPDGDIDNCIMEYQNWLTELGLCIEHPSATRGWCHLSTRLPKSGKRVFFP